MKLYYNIKFPNKKNEIARIMKNEGWILKDQGLRMMNEGWWMKDEGWRLTEKHPSLFIPGVYPGCKGRKEAVRVAPDKRISTDRKYR